MPEVENNAGQVFADEKQRRRLLICVLRHYTPDGKKAELSFAETANVLHKAINSVPSSALLYVLLDRHDHIGQRFATRPLNALCRQELLPPDVIAVASDRGELESLVKRKYKTAHKEFMRWSEAEQGMFFDKEVIEKGLGGIEYTVLKDAMTHHFQERSINPFNVADIAPIPVVSTANASAATLAALGKK